ncbi:iron-siderophore ABC transporter substrate-binding protein [Marinomonas sp. C2222]|uniref:Iron-siderophore ABC transporter substrate-binding protein n=1 Tax=Marinomonas sargassi TaxID=2984494 RepID=A0ABT2YNV3_9GAMM|nr:iron-siderophore ABC transporter substrate-binding protein [Marinomonas sargassi]MCV2401569.1 iron-siderophore ABC transporter substrate-binding protein [Marinomonas sargassi]
MRSIPLFIMFCLLTYGASTSHAEEPRKDYDQPKHPKHLNIAVIDWTHAETLLALGVQPIAMAKKAGYKSWVNEPKVPDEVIDIGLRTQPNMELLSELKPDRILVSPMFHNLEPLLSRIAPVSNIGLYKKGNVSWDSIKEATYAIAREANADEAADTLTSSAEHLFNQLSKQVPNNTPPLLMVQFMDSQHVRVFGNNSLYKTAANQIGLQSAWTENTNSWGFSLVGMDQLMNIKGQILVVKPYPTGAEKHLKENRFWQHLIQRSGHPLLEIDPVWSFGAIPSAMRFASLLTEKLNEGNK